MMTASQIRLWSAMRSYHEDGFSIIPCRADKKPSGQWQEYTVKRASLNTLEKWTDKGITSIGLIGGKISNNVVFIDLDGIPAIQKFAAHFPSLCENTKSVLTGSQEGIHLYVRVDEIPDNINVRVQGVGGFEIRGNGQYVIAPPSPHPSGNLYRVHRDNPIVHLPNIQDVYQWMSDLRETARHNQNQITSSHKPTVSTVKSTRRKANYLKKVINEKMALIQSSGRGNRNETLFRATLMLANFCAGGELDWSDIETLLYTSAMRVFDDKERMEVHRTINSAYRIGIQHPRTIK